MTRPPFSANDPAGLSKFLRDLLRQPSLTHWERGFGQGVLRLSLHPAGRNRISPRQWSVINEMAASYGVVDQQAAVATRSPAERVADVQQRLQARRLRLEAGPGGRYRVSLDGAMVIPATSLERVERWLDGLEAAERE